MIEETKMSGFLTNKEAADFLRTSEVTLWRLRRRGSLPFNRIATKILFRRSDLERFIANNKQNGEVKG
jgi:excisionase family DNA binding protein